MEMLWNKAAELAASGKAFCLVIITKSSGSVPRRAGAAMLVFGEGDTLGTVGGGEIERLCVDTALDAIRQGKPLNRSFTLDDEEGKETGSICGGRISVIFQPQPAKRKAHIFGAGHVARPTAHLLTSVGYHVVIYDESSEFANKSYFPDAGDFVIGNLVELAESSEIGKNDPVLLLTASHGTELEILRTFKSRPPAYLGVIASRKKALHFRNMLMKEDDWTKEEVDSIHAPIGLAISARTPEEIAVSIVAEILKVRGAIE